MSFFSLFRSEKVLFHLQRTFYYGGLACRSQNAEGNRVNEPHVPLAAYKEFSAYKLFVLDIGLLGALSPEIAVRFSLLPYREQNPIINIPLYAVCNL